MNATTYRLTEAADRLQLSVPEVLRLTFEGELELTRRGPHQALHITRRSLSSYLRRPSSDDRGERGSG